MIVVVLCWAVCFVCFFCGLNVFKHFSGPLIFDCFYVFVWCFGGLMAFLVVFVDVCLL